MKLLWLFILAHTVCGFHVTPSHLLLRSRAHSCKTVMSDDIGKRIGRLGKEKFEDAKDWVNEAADPKGFNVRGAGAGAVFGGLIAGPLGAVVGAAIGKNAGVDSAKTKSPMSELSQLTQEIDSQIGVMKANYEMATSSIQGLSSRIRIAQGEAAELHERAKARLIASDEDGARSFLTMRQQALDKIALLEKELTLAQQSREDSLRMLNDLERDRAAITRSSPP